MKTEQQYFEEAISIQQYMDNMSTLREESFAIYNKFHVPNDEFIEQLKNSNLHILAITEDWCGDAMLNNPIVRKVAEAAGLDMRTSLRDADTDLIDKYLTNGGRAIPIYLLLNEAGDVVGKWGPRAPELQQFVMDARSQLPDKEDPAFEEAQKAMYTNMRKQYMEDSTYWTYVYEDFKKVISTIL
ncbi:thioredoxin family protein [Bacillus ndiopicus]|uniref:thioredoxin family protein n=1 Tax=Bacillus ndiopicus TaxID=1347368 RepID=UPI0005A8CA4E|nr:thioredoxin family protein [Bacillus ndiopicus]